MEASNSEGCKAGPARIRALPNSMVSYIDQRVVPPGRHTSMLHRKVVPRAGRPSFARECLLMGA